MRANPILQLRGVVLAGELPGYPFDFTVAPGELWLLNGYPESGRTTLIKTLAGLITPLAGRVELLGHDLAATSPHRLLALRRRLGLVFAEDGLISSWTAFENLALPLRYHQRVEEEALEAHVVHFTATHRFPEVLLGRPVNELERGWRLALALLRAVITDPEALVLDNPLTEALKERERRVVLSVLEWLRERGLALVWSAPHHYSQLFPGAELHLAQLSEGCFSSVVRITAEEAAPGQPGGEHAH